MRRLTIGGAIALLVGVIYLLIAGLMQIGVAVRFPTPKELTYAQFSALHPADGWYKITDSYETLSDYSGRVGLTRLAVVPLRSMSNKTAPVAVFNIPCDARIVSAIGQLDSIGNPVTRAAYVQAHRDGMSVVGPFEGVVVPSADPNALILPLAAGQFQRSFAPTPAIAHHTILLAEGAEPRIDRGVFYVIASLVFAYLIYRWLSWSNKVHVESWQKPDLDTLSPAPAASTLSRTGEVPWWEREQGPPRKSGDSG